MYSMSYVYVSTLTHPNGFHWKPSPFSLLRIRHRQRQTCWNSQAPLPRAYAVPMCSKAVNNLLFFMAAIHHHHHHHHHHHDDHDDHGHDWPWSIMIDHVTSRIGSPPHRSHHHQDHAIVIITMIRIIIVIAVILWLSSLLFESWEDQNPPIQICWRKLFGTFDIPYPTSLWNQDPQWAVCSYWLWTHPQYTACMYMIFHWHVHLDHLVCRWCQWISCT